MPTKRRGQSEGARRHHHAGMGVGAGADVHGVGPHAALLQLRPQLEKAVDVGDAAVDPPVGAGVEGLVPGGAQARHGRLQGGALLGHRRQLHLGAEQVGQEQVALGLGVGVGAAHLHRLQAETGRNGRRLARLVRLRRGGVDKDVASRLHRLGDGVLELADLVATEGQAREILALHPDAGSADRLRQPRQLVEGGGQGGQPQPRQPIQPFAQLLRCVGRRHLGGSSGAVESMAAAGEATTAQTPSCHA